MQRTLLTLALIATAGVAQAQSMSAGEPRDPYGRPLIGRDDWVRQPGDQRGPSTGMNTGMNAGMSASGMSTGSDMAAAPPMASIPAAPTVAGEPRDPYGRPLVGRNDWVRQPGDQQEASGATMSSGAIGTGPHQAAMKDEFGHRYDAQGNRLDARGNVISPQTK